VLPFSKERCRHLAVHGYFPGVYDASNQNHEKLRGFGKSFANKPVGFAKKVDKNYEMCRLGERVGMNEEKNAMSLGFRSQYVYNYALIKKKTKFSS
jgi:hypothetical protein